MTADADVLVVGGGPTGLALALALGRRGTSALVVEQDAGVAELPRAVSIDDEAMRFMQHLGLQDEVRRIAVLGTGTRYYGAGGRALGYARGAEMRHHGHPAKNPIDHSEFQQVLLDGARANPNVTVRHGTRFLDFADAGDAVEATIESRGRRETLRARWLVGCDGGRSAVRRSIGVEMRGSSWQERWLVVDTIRDPHDERYAMHHGDPNRPHVIVVGRRGRCRYEFLLTDDERPEEAELFEQSRALVAPYRSLEPEDVVRCTVYTFHSLVAERWTQGRVIVAGDAAHMMPPFAGQGLNSCLRDAFNLSWKLAMVASGTAGEALLATYEIERRPHVEAMIRLSTRLGRIMMTRNRLQARARDLAFLAATYLPPARRFVEDMRFKPPARYDDGFFPGSEGRSPEPPAGAMIAQSQVLDSDGGIARLDDVLGPGFALIAVDMPPAAFDGLDAATWDRLGVARLSLALDDRLPRPDASCVAIADADGLVGAQLGSVRGKYLLVRPDRFIAGVFGPQDEHEFASALSTALAARGPAGEDRNRVTAPAAHSTTTTT